MNPWRRWRRFQTADSIKRKPSTSDGRQADGDEPTRRDAQKRRCVVRAALIVHSTPTLILLPFAESYAGCGHSAAQQDRNKSKKKTRASRSAKGVFVVKKARNCQTSMPRRPLPTAVAASVISFWPHRASSGAQALTSLCRSRLTHDRHCNAVHRRFSLRRLSATPGSRSRHAISIALLTLMIVQKSSTITLAASNPCAI